MKKVLLYNPRAVFFDMPLALLAIGSVLDRKKYEVIIVDARIEEDPLAIIEKHLPDTLCFGVTALTGSPLKDALGVSREIKKRAPHVPVVWGGWHVSLFPEQTLADESSIDVTVQGQGEQTFLELVNAFDTGSGLEEISGICYRMADGAVKRNPARAIIPMDTFQDVDYSLIDVEKYFQKKGRRQLDYISSTGCHFRCSFCADPFVFQRKWTSVSPGKMLDKIEALYRKYGFTDLNLQDETYFTFKDRVVEIAQGFIDRGIRISWAATMRADQGARMSEEDFECCAKSGLRRVLIGVESGSQAMMDWLRKDIKMEQVYLCAERCKRYKIAVIFPFIVGFPGESRRSVDDSVRMILELNQMHPDFQTPVFYFKPYPGSTITSDVEKMGYKLPATIQEWSDFDYIGSSGPWVSEEKYRFFERFKFYLKLAYGKRRLPLLPLQFIARKRCEKNWFAFPVESWLYNVFFQRQKLS